MRTVAIPIYVLNDEELSSIAGRIEEACVVTSGADATEREAVDMLRAELSQRLRGSVTLNTDGTFTAEVPDPLN